MEQYDTDTTQYNKRIIQRYISTQRIKNIKNNFGIHTTQKLKTPKIE